MKDIKGWEGLYAITKDGRVWARNRIIPRKTRGGKVINKKYGGKWLAVNTNKKGDWYMSIVFQNTRQFRKGYKVHRLVADAFIPNLLGLKEVNHKNGIKTDNRVENLEWVTRKENLAHGLKILPSKDRKIQRGEMSWCHKLTEKDIREIRRLSLLRKSWKSHDFSNRKLAKQFGVSTPTVWGIINGIYWKHVI